MPHPVSELQQDVHEFNIDGGTVGVDTENLPGATHFDLLAETLAKKRQEGHSLSPAPLNKGKLLPTLPTFWC